MGTVNNVSPVAQRMVCKAKEVLPLPAAVAQLCQMGQNPNVDMTEVLRIVSQDSGLTGQILRVANSSFYGLSQMIGTVSEAVVILGLQTVRNLALGVSVIDVRNRIKKDLPLSQEDFWRHSLAVASASRLLAPRLGVRDSEEAFVVGLLHDIGKIFLMDESPERYAKVLAEAEKGSTSLGALENEFFKTNHAEVGGMLCQEWKTPPILSMTVARHHQVMDGDAISQEDRMLLCTQVANHVANLAQIGFSGNPNVNVAFLRGLEKEGVFPDYLCRTILALPEEVHKAEIFLNLHSPISTNQTLDPDARKVGLWVEDSKECEILRMILLNRGFRVILTGETEKESSLMDVAVVDASVGASQRELFEKQGVILMDFGRWKAKQVALRGENCLNAQKLYDWLDKGMQKMNQPKNV